MGNSLRCCLACVLPCGAFDVVRIVHLSGQVEEHSRHVSAGEVLAANPGHILSEPCGSSQGGGAVRRCISIVSPESQLQRGHIYFLIPAAIATLHDHEKKIHTRNHHHQQQQRRQHESVKDRQDVSQESPAGENPSHRRRRRTGRVGVWRPHLESICEGL
ncbi:uncharacterized protein LOC122004043 [Zingiber officinale]|uniref:Uncharacterized protein n=1 Tax=Zingiber officinale TaxID=94328 RepID=A0A8J5G3G8_ZINOF|nr:uncharacterized protein LOC122004043 [Zingiber officinale]KAG6490839.1 hypothetical protein ZIOFF_052154 [Zingiber officinale]